MAEARIVVVEDESIVAMDLAATLRNLGCEVLAIVNNGRDAIDAAVKHRPDLVLMDIRLKGPMDGIEAAKAIHDRQQTPIVFLTAHGDTTTVDRAMGSAPYGYLVKPFDEAELQRVITVALSRHSHEAREHARIDDALWESEEKFRLLVDSIQDYAIFLLDLEGRIVTWNTGAEKITGFTGPEVIGKPVTELRGDCEPDTLSRELEQLAQSGRIEFEEWRMRKDGTRYWAHIVRTQMLDRGGRRLGYVTVTHDETQRRTLEAQLLQSQKLESLGKLAGGIAHDFNNMLMVIFSRIELLSRVNGAQEPQRRYIHDVRAAATRSRDLTQQLLAAARRQVLQPQIVSLNDIVINTMQLLASSIGEHIALRTHTEERLWNIYADPSKLHQVLMNLAINAKEAMPRGGALTVETRNVRVDAAYVRQRPHLREGDFVELIVSDTGMGIPPDIRDQIYDPFFSTRGRGSGLGLAVVRGIIDQTGGQIWLYSEVGQGTTFKIFFPRVSGPIAPVEDADDAAVLPARGTESILVVEDEQLVRTILRETLEEQGYHVLEASTHAEALALTRNPGVKIDLLLTDVVLPDRNGRTLAEAARERRRRLPVIYMSGYTDNAIAEQGLLEPGVRFLEKPVPTNVLLRAVRAALDAPSPDAV
ncbi:MAG TPA: response regulator [Thermoanaerobaculia bacterium]|nr:response regulator [Thermoanaerobaculia bacterium]